MRWAGFAILLVMFLPLLLQAASASGPIIVVDSFGRLVEIPEKPMRIVSLAPSITETLFAMGLGDRVVGVTSFCNYPPQVPELVKEGRIQVVGGFTDPSLEKIIALKPDLVLGHNLLSPDLVKRLEELGIPVVVIRTPESIEELYQAIFLIGRACGEDGRAARLVESLISGIGGWGKLLGDVEKLDAAYIVSYGPIWIAGSGTYVDDLIELAGGKNAFSDKSWWASISVEELVARDPRILIASDKQVYESLMDLKGRGLIHGEIKIVSPDPIARPGPRITYALEELINAIHPEIWSRAVEVVELRAPAKASASEQIRVEVRVANPGLLEGEKVVELRFGGEVYARRVYLRPGEVQVAAFELSPPRPGVYLVEAGGRYALCEVVGLGVEEMGKSLESILTGLRGIDASIREIYNSSSTIADRLRSLTDELAGLRMYAAALAAVSLIALAIAAASMILALKSRR